MILIFSSKLSPRLKYILNQVFGQIMQVEFKLTNVLEEFLAHNGPKINYSKKQFSTEFFIRSNDLLFEQGINDLDLKISDWDGLPIFFQAGQHSALPFDLFAASFYLMTRYEEYLPQLRDFHDRYPFAESIAYREGFLDKPLVDLWIVRFKEVILDKYPDFVFEDRKVEVEATIQVDKAFKYLKKGAVRTIAGFSRDLLRFRFKEIYRRTMVLLYVRKDPFDTYDSFIAWKRRTGIKTTFFYLIGAYSNFDKNISFTKSTYKELIKSNTDYAELGLLASYHTMNDMDKLGLEKFQMQESTHWEVKKSKQYYTRVKLPETYQNLVDVSMDVDYSMGYEDALGFRASTCTPFYFYDLDFEIQTPLLIKPFYFNDRLFIGQRMSPRLAYEKMIYMYEMIEKIGGFFPVIFHNDTLAMNSGKQSWKRIYEELLSRI